MAKKFCQTGFSDSRAESRSEAIGKRSDPQPNGGSSDCARNTALRVTWPRAARPAPRQARAGARPRRSVLKLRMRGPRGGAAPGAQAATGCGRFARSCLRFPPPRVPPGYRARWSSPVRTLRSSLFSFALTRFTTLA